MTQSGYALDILTKQNKMLNCLSCKSLVSLGSKLQKDEGDLLLDATAYRDLVGSLQYLSQTRPSLTYSINQVAQFVQQPRTSHLVVVKRILRYIKGTQDHGLHFTKSKQQNILYGYCDADFAGDPNSKISTIGLCVYLNGNLITWSSKKKNTVSRSNVEAKYRTLASMAIEIRWVTFICGDLTYPIYHTP